MQINREEFLRVLQSVSPGLAQREIIEQSSCFIFIDGRVMTFNDEVCCSRDSPLPELHGALRAQKTLDLLSKLTEDELDVSMNEDGTELLVKGAGRRSGLRMEAQVVLPVDSIEIPTEWRELDARFAEGVSLVHGCASTEMSQFVLTCVHIHPDYVEASDRFQIARFPIPTGFPQSILVRAQSLCKIIGYDMTMCAETGGWVHFKNPTGLVMSIRRHLDSGYRDLSEFITPTGTSKVTLPGGLEEAVGRSNLFSSEKSDGNVIKVSFRPNKLMIEGEGPSGWFKEQKPVAYEGQPVSFLIAPKLLIEVSKRSSECGISDNRLFIDGGKFLYATATHVDSSAVSVG